MNAAGYGKNITVTEVHLTEASKILQEGVDEVISEDVALLCADTQLMMAEFEIQRARRSIANRRRELHEGV